MSQVYNLSRVKSNTQISRNHKIPRGSTPRMRGGESVKPADILAVADVAANHELVDVAEQLNIPPRQVAATLTKREGEVIQEGDVLATKRTLLGLRKKQVLSPIDGTIITLTNGKVLLEGDRIFREIGSKMSGKVTMIEPDSHITVLTTGAVLQLAWGFGGLAFGTLRMLDMEPGLQTDSDRFNIDHRGAIVAIASPLTDEFMKGAAEIRVKGLVGSSLDANLIPLVKELEFPVVVSQGFGQLAMDWNILNLLSSYNGRELILDTTEASDWRNKRPEIIIPLPEAQADSVSDDQRVVDYSKGQKVRILYAPYLAEIGTIVALPKKPQQLPSGLTVYGAEVALDSGETFFVPFNNMEHLG